MADLMRGEPILLRDGSLARVHPNVAAGSTREKGEAGKPADEKQQYTVITGDPETLPLYEHGLFTENELWSCTTCRACMEECPAMIEHVDQIVDLRRNLTMIQSEVPGGVKRVLEGIERAGNPWRLPTRDRSAWADGLGVPTLAENSAMPSGSPSALVRQPRSYASRMPASRIVLPHRIDVPTRAAIACLRARCRAAIPATHAERDGGRQRGGSPVDRNGSGWRQGLAGDAPSGRIHHCPG